jgi:hypothetical protein
METLSAITGMRSGAFSAKDNPTPNTKVIAKRLTIKKDNLFILTSLIHQNLE